jgi:hypothetical protein
MHVINILMYYTCIFAVLFEWTKYVRSLRFMVDVGVHDELSYAQLTLFFFCEIYGMT